MSRRFTAVTIVLVAVVAFLVGAILAGGLDRARVEAGQRPAPARPRATIGPGAPVVVPAVNFADVLERVNQAVVNVDATAQGNDTRRRRRGPGDDGRGDGARRGAGSGFIIDADGSILTNHHVIDRAERITVKLADGRSLRARVIGTDPDTDIALIKVDGQRDLPVAPLGDSSALRMGEWVCAIGNPLGYEHTVTVGVVSYVGRKLADTSLGHYIQTDAAINFGNSGGPLINTRGEVIGINAAVSSRASNIGFAVPISGATAILPQLRATGRVSRGYIGVGARSIDGDLQASLELKVSEGALVQDVVENAPADRAGVRPYDVVLAVDGAAIRDDESLTNQIASRKPGTTASLRVSRDGRELTIGVKLAERPGPQVPGPERSAAPARNPAATDDPLGLTVRDLDAAAFNRYRLPGTTRGVLITRVEPIGVAADVEIQRGMVLLEVNRRPVTTPAEYRRATVDAAPGDILALYLYLPDAGQRQIRTVRIEEP
jgi:serine protease Do